MARKRQGAQEPRRKARGARECSGNRSGASAELADRKRGPSRPQESKFLLTPTGVSLEDLEKDLIRQAMELAQNNKTNAAKLLNMSYDSFRYQIKKLGME